LLDSGRIDNEIRHGRFIASKGEQVWNWSSPAGRLRWQRRVMLFRDLIGDQDREVLELGCGTGLFTKELAVTKNRITAVDISPELLEYAKTRVPFSNVVFRIENAYATSFVGESFDFVVGSSVLHHLEVEMAILEIYRLLREGGRFMFTEPNMMNPQIALQKNIPLLKKALGDSPDETAFVRWRIRKTLESVGFKDVSAEPFDFLHPRTPTVLIPWISKISRTLESFPIVREIGGSLVLCGRK